MEVGKVVPAVVSKSQNLPVFKQQQGLINSLLITEYKVCFGRCILEPMILMSQNIGVFLMSVRVLSLYNVSLLCFYANALSFLPLDFH